MSKKNNNNMILLSTILRLYHKSSSSRYIKYLRNIGMRIGENTTFLAPSHTYIDEGRSNFISIGNDCVICRNVTMIAHDYSWSILLKAYNEFIPSGGGEISIGNNVFIGEGAMILRNVTIGDNSIVAAGSVVTKNIPSNMVYGGNPAHFIMTLDEYKSKRKDKIDDEVRNNIKTLISRGITDINQLEIQMKNFRPIYLKRTHDNKEKYLSSFSPIGIAKNKINEIWNKTENIFSDFEDFYKKHMTE